MTIKKQNSNVKQNTGAKQSNKVKQSVTKKKSETKLKNSGINTAIRKYKTELKPAKLPNSRPETGATLILNETTPFPFDGSQVMFPIDETNCNDEVTLHFDILGACRDSKPCANWKPYANLTFYAIHRSTGESVILKVMSDNTKSVDPMTGQPRQCAIDERKEHAGLEKMGTNWCVMIGKPKIDEEVMRVAMEERDDLLKQNGLKKLSASDNVKVRPKWATHKPLNFQFAPYPTRYIIIRDCGYRKVLGAQISFNRNFLRGKYIFKEVMWIILFKTVYTYDNHFAQILVSDDYAKVLSIDEEDLAEDAAQRKSKIKKWSNKPLSEYFGHLVEKSVRAIPGFYDSMKLERLGMLVRLNRLKELELSIDADCLNLQKFNGIRNNIEALIQLFESFN